MVKKRTEAVMAESLASVSGNRLATNSISNNRTCYSLDGGQVRVQQEVRGGGVHAWLGKSQPLYSNNVMQQHAGISSH